MRNLYLLPVILLVTSCVDPRAAQMDQYYEYCEQTDIWLEKAECYEAINDQDYRMANDDVSGEIRSFRRLLIEKVKSKKMTNSEADYAYTQKLIEIRDRMIQNQLILRSMTPPPQTVVTPSYGRKIRTQCKPTIGGGFDCTQEPSGPDLSVFHRVR